MPTDAGHLPFDLPLDPPQAPARKSSAPGIQPELPLEPVATPPPDLAGDATAFAASDGTPDPAAALSGRRWAAGALDSTAHLAILASGVAGSWWLGVPPDRLSLLPLAVLTACFSFVYHVLPLTFWGHTPGMAAIGLVARSSDGGPLTIQQAVERWLGVTVNALTLGIAFALSRGRSLADRFSRSAVTATAP